MTPWNLEAEQAVLGAILLTDDVVIPQVLAQGLRPEDFYQDRHRVIFSAMVRMYEDHRHVDVLTLSEFLATHDCLERAGGRAALDLLNGSVPAVGHLSEYVRIVVDSAFFRRTRTIGMQLAEAAVRRDVAECRLLIGNAVALLPKDGPRAVEERRAA